MEIFYYFSFYWSIYGPIMAISISWWKIRGSKVML